MFSAIRLITLSPTLPADARSEVTGALQAAARAHRATGTLFAPTCPGTYNGGDFIWRSEYPDEAAYRAAESSGDAVATVLGDPNRVAHVEHVAFAAGTSGGRSPVRGVYRVALFCANRNSEATRLARFSAETLAMPRQVRAIRRWQLATPAVAHGSRAWTHVWEQEYDDLTGLTGPYMMHPCHWGEVDRWFDPEEPDFLVDPFLCHSFCETAAPVISGSR